MLSIPLCVVLGYAGMRNSQIYYLYISQQSCDTGSCAMQTKLTLLKGYVDDCCKYECKHYTITHSGNPTGKMLILLVLDTSLIMSNSYRLSSSAMYRRILAQRLVLGEALAALAQASLKLMIVQASIIFSMNFISRTHPRNK